MVDGSGLDIRDGGGIAKTKGPAEFSAARGKAVSIADPFAPLMLTYDVGAPEKRDERSSWERGFIIGPGY